MDFKGLYNRALKIITNPASEWMVIKNETENRNEIIRNYAFPLILLVLVCSLIGNFLFHARFGSTFVIVTSIITLLVAVAMMYISAIVINEITTSFGAKKNIDASFKLVIYSFTAYFIARAAAGLIAVYPISVLLNLFSLYSIYLFWLGAAPVMEVPEDKKAGFVVVSILIMIAINVIMSFILGLIFSSFLIGYGLNTL